MYKGLILVLILASACGKSNNDSGKKNLEPTFESLHDKTAHEALKLKYNDISVNCALRVQGNQKVNLNLPPTKTFSWKILTEQEKVKKIDISHGVFTGSISYSLSEIHMIDSLYFTVPGGFEYQLESTPAINIQSIMKLKHKSQSTGLHRDGLEVELVENTGITNHTRTYQVNGVDTHLINLRCSLDSKIKPSYKHQFIEVK